MIYLSRVLGSSLSESHFFSIFSSFFLKFSSQIEVKSVSKIRHKIVLQSSLEVSGDLSGAIWTPIGPILRAGEDQWSRWSARTPPGHLPHTSRTPPGRHFWSPAARSQAAKQHKKRICCPKGGVGKRVWRCFSSDLGSSSFRIDFWSENCVCFQCFCIDFSSSEKHKLRNRRDDFM